MWEYKYVTSVDADNLMEQLNEHGKRDWELVTILRGKLHDTAYLKRQINV